MAKGALKGEIRGLEIVQENMAQVITDLHGKPMLDAFRRATMLVWTSARRNAPVDTGRLRSSITPEVRLEGNRIQGVVGSNVVYAPYMEFGTGTFAGNAPHYPPASALETWASRHGFGPGGGFIVARAIGRRGGLEPRNYLRDAFDDNRQRIRQIIGNAVSGIVK